MTTEETIRIKAEEMIDTLKKEFKNKGAEFDSTNEMFLRMGMEYGINLSATLLSSMPAGTIVKKSEKQNNSQPQNNRGSSYEFAKDTLEGYSEPIYQCPKPKCGGGMCKDLNMVLTSKPPQYLYKCNKCGHVVYHMR